MKVRGSLLVLTVVAFMGCSGPAAKISPEYKQSGLAGAPQWVLQPPADGKIVAAIGSAEHSPGGINFQRTEAMANARNEIAKILNVKVKNLFEKFERSSGVGKDITFDKVASDVTKQITNTTLSGSVQKDIWVSGDGTMYVLVMLDSKLADAVKEGTRSAMKNDKALYQIAESRDALNHLDEEIDKEFK